MLEEDGANLLFFVWSMLNNWAVFKSLNWANQLNFPQFEHCLLHFIAWNCVKQRISQNYLQNGLNFRTNFNTLSMIKLFKKTTVMKKNTKGLALVPTHHPPHTRHWQLARIIYILPTIIHADLNNIILYSKPWRRLIHQKI